MSSQLLTFFFLLLATGIRASPLARPAKFYVFGDSYADTGNVGKLLGASWNLPYGSTFPGHPAGRYCDGRLLTDYLAKLMGLYSPLPYRLMKHEGTKIRNGLNFAFGGSGVFDTVGTLLPNMTTQIGFLETLIHKSVYTKNDLQSSAVLVCLSGNDYAAFVLNGGTPSGLKKFIPTVVNQLVANLRRLSSMGATRIAVTTLQPLGCLPRTTLTSGFKQCNATLNRLVEYHNILLRGAVMKMNDERSGSRVFAVDLYDSFTAVLRRKGGLLRACCEGLGSGNSCGSVDGNGRKLYRVCGDPKGYFFWDSSHPTQAGWGEVFELLKPSVGQFFEL